MELHIPPLLLIATIAVIAPLVVELPLGCGYQTRGIKFDVEALLTSPSALLRLPVFLLCFLVVRGVPVCLYRREVEKADLLPLALYAATALPLVVAITEIGVATGRMRTENAAP